MTSFIAYEYYKEVPGNTRSPYKYKSEHTFKFRDHEMERLLSYSIFSGLYTNLNVKVCHNFVLMQGNSKVLVPFYNKC
ncbi:hypothetical protein SAMN04488601_1012540 [Paenibacillus sp. 453mf]|nr:hypothetical protein SAMN04488601_1012540 [Paenibacillus sp. 453mf]